MLNASVCGYISKFTSVADGLWPDHTFPLFSTITNGKRGELFNCCE